MFNPLYTSDMFTPFWRLISLPLFNVKNVTFLSTCYFSFTNSSLFFSCFVAFVSQQPLCSVAHGFSHLFNSTFFSSAYFSILSALQVRHKGLNLEWLHEPAGLWDKCWFKDYIQYEPVNDRATDFQQETALSLCFDIKNVPTIN